MESTKCLTVQVNFSESVLHFQLLPELQFRVEFQCYEDDLSKFTIELGHDNVRVKIL